MRATVARTYAAVAALAVAVVLLRLPYRVAPEGNDEGGYLVVAGQWHGGGTSLYGHYWVDRPPLLIALFQLASALGGLPALRVVGAVAAAIAVLGVAEVCRCVGGPRAALVGAVVSAAMFVSPQLGTVQVNGEMLAAPFIAWSMALTLHALRPLSDGSPRVRSWLAAFGAGALGLAALLVKQNMVEPVVFGVVTVLFASRAGRKAGRRAGPTTGTPAPDVRRIATAAAAGAGATLLAVGGWTLLHGTSLVGVFDAMYPFRARAAAVLATLPDAGQARRANIFLHVLLGSGVLLVVAVFAWAAWRWKDRPPAVWGLSATLVWATASMLLSGGFWDHYLVELVVPVAMAGGVAAGRPRTSGSRAPGALVPYLAAVVVAVVALTHWTGALTTRMSDRGVRVGAAIGAAARPGDTVVSAMGDAELVHTSGLSSPYPYLWTLPAQVDDPRLSRLTSLLDGRDAPTWLVSWDRPSFPTPVQQRLAAVVSRHYRQVGLVCGQPILLRDGVVRRTVPSQPCTAPVAKW